MKKLLSLLVLSISTISCSNAQKTEFSKESLTKELTTLEGEKINFETILNNQKGKAVVIEVWASWCGDCVKAMPKLKALQAENPEVAFVFISMDKTFEKWKLGVEKHELKGAQFWAEEGMKGAFGKAIDLDWIPRYIVLDKTGKVVLYRAIETAFEKINTTLKTLN